MGKKRKLMGTCNVSKISDVANGFLLLVHQSHQDMWPSTISVIKLYTRKTVKEEKEIDKCEQII